MSRVILVRSLIHPARVRLCCVQSQRAQHQDTRKLSAKERVFLQCQQLLKDISRFDESKIFSRTTVKKLRSPQFVFMTDEQLDAAKREAYRNVRSKLQMPPVMEPDTNEPEILSYDPEIKGYAQNRVMFVDVTLGYSNRNRLMSVRETDGTLRYPNHEERSRMNHIFFPRVEQSIDVPKMFEDENLIKVLDRGDYKFILDRACLQFEPDDPRYVALVHKTYNHIDRKGNYDSLRSTRHFGPMALYLAANERITNLILDMLNRNYKEDAEKLVKIYNEYHQTDKDLNDFLGKKRQQN